jgi:AMP deaminase
VALVYPRLINLSLAVSSGDQAQMLQALQRCLQLRDKYMLKSMQRFGDDPRHYDGVFLGTDPIRGGAFDPTPDLPVDASANLTQLHHEFKPWKIYPGRPPRKRTEDAEDIILSEDEMDIDFRFEECEIPEGHSWAFKLAAGVFQVYESSEDKSKYSTIDLLSKTHRMDRIIWTYLRDT